MGTEAKELFSTAFYTKWYSYYAKLEVFAKQQERPTAVLDEQMVQWVEIQRRIKHMLPDKLKEKLAELNFEVEENINSWDAKYNQLFFFVQETGHTTLPNDEKYEQLKDWLIRQIISKRSLSEKQYQLLDKLEVDWDMPISREHRWDQMYWRLHDFYKTFGHCRVPQRWQNDKQLALWVIVQRRTYAQGKLCKYREQKLNELNFTWSIKDVYDALWEDFFKQLLSFHKKNGHCRVPCRYEKLVSWIERQRLARKKDQLPQERVMRLEEINFIWSCDDMKRCNWEARYKQLKDYKKKYGHSFVPTNCRENRSLGIWVSTQRGLEAKGKLQASKKKKLDQLGFVWRKDTQHKLQSVYDKKWNAKFEKLKIYKQLHGTCQVSLKIDPVLQRWTSWQRKLFLQNKLSQDRIGRLNKIQFPWSVEEGYWLRMYEALVDFKKNYGHTRVPFQWESNLQLSGWVYKIRTKKEELSTQKVELLDQLGFDWSLNRRTVTPWETMYELLLKFCKEHGHARVPVKWPKDPKLGKWVSRMRQEREKLNQDRVFLLESINFEWSIRAIQKAG